MLQQGFLAEVESLLGRGDLHRGMPSMRAVGYRQAVAHLFGESDHAEFVEKGLAATRQLAKRQLTWLRKWSDALVVVSDDPEDARNAVLTRFIR
jgi:tRNA dimethylallyltransferase